MERTETSRASERSGEPGVGRDGVPLEFVVSETTRVEGRARTNTGTNREIRLTGRMSMPSRPRGVVLILNRTGRSCESIDSHHTSAVLRRQQLGSVLVDLLTDEEMERADAPTIRYDVPRMVERLAGVLRGLRERLPDEYGPLYLFGSGTSSGAALGTAAAHPDLVDAVASRGGRPELAGDRVDAIEAPVLILRGERDRYGLAADSALCEKLRSEAQFVTIRGTDGLFESPAAVHEAARVAGDWFSSLSVDGA